MTYLDELARPVRAKLLAYAADVRAERHTGQRGYFSDDDERWHVYGGASAYGDRAALEYTDRNRAHANALLRAAGVRLTRAQAEGLLQQALLAYDQGERVTVASMESSTERVRALRARLPAGSCVTGCGRQARAGRKTCEPCNEAAKARVRAARERAKA